MLDEFKKVMKQYNIPAGDFPNIDRFRSKVVEVRRGVETGCGDGVWRWGAEMGRGDGTWRNGCLAAVEQTHKL